MNFYGVPAYKLSFTHYDPIEDTETSQQIAWKEMRCRFTHYDPIEDTETKGLFVGREMADLLHPLRSD